MSDGEDRGVYDFHRIETVQKDLQRRVRSGIKSDSENKRKLMDPLQIGELVLILAERLKKKRCSGQIAQKHNVNFLLCKSIDWFLYESNTGI